MIIHNSLLLAILLWLLRVYIVLAGDVSSALQSAHSPLASGMAENSGGLDKPPGTVYAPPPEGDIPVTKRGHDFIKAYVRRQLAQNTSFLYQFSPHVLPAALHRKFTGIIVPTFDKENALLNGRGQVVTTHGEREYNGACNSTDPIKLYSGRGNTVEILVEDIPFDGGLLHIVSE